MELHLTDSDLEAMIDRWVSETGRPAEELVEYAVAAYFSELVQVRTILDNRYDDIQSGKVKLVDGEEALVHLKEKTEADRRHPA